MSTPFDAIPNAPIPAVPPEGSINIDVEEVPALRSIVVVDLVGPGAANRQPNALAKARDTLIDRVNRLIEDHNAITGVKADATNFTPDGNPMWLPRDGAFPALCDIDIGTNKLLNVAPGTNPTDGVNFSQISGLGNFLSRDGSNDFVGPQPLQFNDHQIKGLAFAVDPRDAVPLEQIEDLVGNSLTKGSLTDYKHGSMTPRAAVNAKTNTAFQVTLDNADAKFYLFSLQFGPWLQGANSEEHITIRFKYDIDTREVSGEGINFVNQSANPLTTSVTTDILEVLPIDGTRKRVAVLTANTGSPRHIILDAQFFAGVGGSPDVINWFIYYTDAPTVPDVQGAEPPVFAGDTAVYTNSGVWEAWGFNSFGGATLIPTGGLNYVAAGTHGSGQSLYQEVTTASTSNTHTYSLTQFTGIDRDRIVAVFIRATAAAGAHRGNQMRGRVEVEIGGAFETIKVQNPDGFNNDDDGSSSAVLAVPINRTQQDLVLRISEELGEPAGDLGVSASFDIVGFWLANNPLTGGSTTSAGSNLRSFRSPWTAFDVTSAGQSITFLHNLGDVPDFLELQVRDGLATRVIDVDRTQDAGASITDITATEVTVRISGEGFTWIDEPDAPESSALQTGQIRLVAGLIADDLASALGAQLNLTPSYVNPPQSGNWSILPSSTSEQTPMIVDPTKPNRVGIFQIDLSLEAPNDNVDDPTYPRFLINGDAGFQREVVVQSAGSNDQVAQSTMVLMQVDSSGSIEFEVENNGSSIGGGTSERLWRIAHLGWVDQAALPDGSLPTSLASAVSVDHVEAIQTDVAPGVDPTVASFTTDVDADTADLYTLDASLGITSHPSTASTINAEVMLKYDVATGDISGSANFNRSAATGSSAESFSFTLPSDDVRYNVAVIQQTGGAQLVIDATYNTGTDTIDWFAWHRTAAGAANNLYKVTGAARWIGYYGFNVVTRDSARGTLLGEISNPPQTNWVSRNAFQEIDLTAHVTGTVRKVLIAVQTSGITMFKHKRLPIGPGTSLTLATPSISYTQPELDKAIVEDAFLKGYAKVESVGQLEASSGTVELVEIEPVDNKFEWAFFDGPLTTGGSVIWLVDVLE